MSRKNGADPARGRERKNTHLTVSIPRELREELENAAAWLSGHPHWLNQSRIVSEALQHWLEKLRKAHNDGEPFGPPPGFPGHRRGRPRNHAA